MAPMQSLQIATTNDGTLARHQNIFRGLHPMGGHHGLRQRRGRKMIFHKMDNHRKVDNKVPACYTRMDRSLCLALHKSLCLLQSLGPSLVALFHQILA
ncbi:MAG: hypothetical protein KG012_05430 [Deltaproteobacteria bacterium]|nr:hypothetical protein [Deltaproteobacteria bacterium]